MSAVLGQVNPEVQRALLTLCFARRAVPEAVAVVDDALQRDALDSAQLRVLPLVYRRRGLEGFSAPTRAMVVNSYRHTLFRNTMMLDRLDVLRNRLVGAGFAEPVALKGVPALAYLGDGIGSRPMADVDILVPKAEQRSDDLLKVLDGLGYRVSSCSVRSVTLRSAEGLELDLHWWLQEWALGDAITTMIAGNSERCTFGRGAFLIPCFEHHLAHVLAHGVLSPYLAFEGRWVFDVLAMFRFRPHLDLHRFAMLVNAVDAPRLVGDVLTALAADLPPEIDVDRGQLRSLADAVNRRATIGTWLYAETPRPAEFHSRPVVPRRLDRVRSLLRQYWWIPRQLRRRQGIRYDDYLQRLRSFSSSARVRGPYGATLKELCRFPGLLLRFAAGR